MKHLCKVWIDMEVGDGTKGCRKGFESANMEHSQVAAYVTEVLASGHSFQLMTINIKDLGDLPEIPRPKIAKATSTAFADLDDGD